MKKDLIYKVLDTIPISITHIINGGAAGADSIAGLWALDRGILVDSKRPDWRKHGKAAGIIHNAEMLESGVELVIAFPGGRGTEDMISRTKKAGIEVIQIKIIDEKPRCISSFSKEDSLLNRSR